MVLGQPKNQTESTLLGDLGWFGVVWVLKRIGWFRFEVFKTRLDQFGSGLGGQ